MQNLSTYELTKSYKGRKVVDGITIEITQGEIVGLLGPNGAGKTTTFQLIVGLASPDSGQVQLNGADITRLPMYLRARNGISYLPQEASVFRKLTVEENILAVLETLPLDRQQRRSRVEELIESLGLHQVAHSYGYQLSGGERRRVEIARSLVISPAFILLDEPFSGIDPLTVADIQEIIIRLKQGGIGILVTDHNVPETLQVTDRAYIIMGGRIFRSGTPEVLGNDSDVRRFYLGEKFRLAN